MPRLCHGTRGIGKAGVYLLDARLLECAALGSGNNTTAGLITIFMQIPYLADRGAVAEATRLIANHGDVAAAAEAAQRAARSRDIGNHIHFCRWRQIERLIRLLAQPCAAGTVH